MLQRIWNLLCSLKLTIVLASAATLLTIGGSVMMIRYPKTFGMIDQMPLGAWFTRFGGNNLAISGWFWIVCLLIILLGINTLCCFLDWLPRIRTRWRKSGEYLIHLGFVLILIAFIWGSYSGDRSEGNRIAVGETFDLAPLAPGYRLRLNAFEPTFSPEGRPNDMRSSLTLFKGDAVVKEGTIRLNHPMTHDDLVILPASMDQSADGFRFNRPDGTQLELRPGAIVRNNDGAALRILTFHADVTQMNGQVVPTNGELSNPAFEIEVLAPGREPWRGWYILRQGPPSPLIAAGFPLQPVEPLGAWISILTINRDPGADLALLGGWCLGIGALFALFSFYDKRQRGDRPDVI